MRRRDMPLFGAGYIFALAAFSRVLLAVLQILFTLPPALMNSAAEASATNAMSKLYSIRSWPSSSFQKLRTNVMGFAPLAFAISLLEIAGLRFCGRAAALHSAAPGGNLLGEI